MKHPTRMPPSGSRRAVTIKEVAAEAGVSTATVSRVLAGLEGVTGELKRRVNRAATKLDYHPNRMARGLRLGQRKVVGMIIPDMRNPFFTSVAYGVEAALHREGYTLLLGNSDGQPEREQEHLKALRGEGVAGLVFMAGNGSEPNYEVLRAWRIPVVAVDRSPGGLDVDWVCSDNREGMRQAVSHLLSLGYKDIALLNGPAEINVSQERLGGYEEALRGVGLSKRDALVVHSDFQQAGGYAAMCRLLELPKPPRAVVVANNLMTVGALQAIHERKVRIPEQLAVVGFDDIPWAESLNPPLTAVAQPVEELGQVAAHLLLERLADPSRMVRQVVMPTRLMVRASCGAPQVAETLRAGRPEASGPAPRPAGASSLPLSAASMGSPLQTFTSQQHR